MPHQLTFVCALESGRLEEETLLMVQSLRAFGGRLRDAPVMAVIGRCGPSLRPDIVAGLRALDVEIVRADLRDNRYPWFGYSNKIMAVRTADRRATTPVVTWLDSDILVAAEPSGLLLADDEDFAARTEPLNAAVTATDRRNENYWIALCQLLGVDYATLPWLPVEGEKRLAYYNSGVFSWRRNSGFGAAYVDAFWRLLDSRLAQPNGAFFSADQVILSPVVTGLQLRWRHLPQRDHHMLFPPLLAQGPSIAGSAVLHYSRSMGGEHLPVMLDRIAREHPTLAEWLHANMTAPTSVGRGVAGQRWLLRKGRGLRWALYARGVKVVR